MKEKKTLDATVDKIKPNDYRIDKAILLPATMPRRNQQRKTNTDRQSGRRKAKPIKFNPREIEIEQRQILDQQLVSASTKDNNAIDECVNDGSTPDEMDNANTMSMANSATGDENNEHAIQMDDNINDTMTIVDDKMIAINIANEPSIIIGQSIHHSTATATATTNSTFNFYPAIAI